MLIYDLPTLFYKIAKWSALITTSKSPKGLSLVCYRELADIIFESPEQNKKKGDQDVEVNVINK